MLQTVTFEGVCVGSIIVTLNELFALQVPGPPGWLKMKIVWVSVMISPAKSGVPPPFIAVK